MTAYVGLGSNVGRREAHLAHALRRLASDGAGASAEHPPGSSGRFAVSSVWETEPVGFTDQAPFLNLVARLETELNPDALLGLARRVEAERGRERSFRNAPRTLDVDLLLYGDVRVERPGLTIPHPRMRGRWFVLAPLVELAPELRDPVLGDRYADLLPSDPPGIRRVGPGTMLLETLDDDD